MIVWMKEERKKREEESRKEDGRTKTELTQRVVFSQQQFVSERAEMERKFISLWPMARLRCPHS